MTLALHDLLADPARVADLTPDERQRLAAELAAFTLLILTGTSAPVAAPEPEPTHEAGRWIEPGEAAAIAGEGVSRRVIYGWSRRRDWRAFTRRLSRKKLRIEEGGLRRWLASRT